MLRKPLTPIPDDTEEAPWMVMGMPQSNSTAAFYTALRAEIRARPEPFLVAAMLPIRYRPIPAGRIEQLAPDVMVARVTEYDRDSYDVEREGVAPAFVLEVVSAESRKRDLELKPERYERMGVEEYALFAPRTADGHFLIEPPLMGYRLDPTRGQYAGWAADASGRLYSQVLDLWLVVHDGELRAQRPDGSLVPTLDETIQTHAQLEEAIRTQQRLEAEIARLRAELERRNS